MLTIIVIAKECLPGRVKTRLTPELSFEQAAAVASASLADTLDAIRAVPATRRILAFDGRPSYAPAEAHGFEIIPQADGDLSDRLAAIFDQCSGPTLLVGMDTPQVNRQVLEPALGDWSGELDAWFGFASDGGFWALALADPDGSLIRGVPMSRPDTGRLQLERLLDAGLRVKLLPVLTDVDTVDDAAEVAEIAPDGRFAEAVSRAFADNLVGARSAAAA
ncbi:TIGR04282 family arsenosugar biosynthesis glycosyltransferase [Subtercola frigoramans]|uniref:Glycosyltransferase A (GT-A) superfamily protein (DUF2064 family) n=1 Tax=Subtercola frigoramans TaxID=120298 RepID=A0ABS2L3B5_9MICO|nr:DUF2064 domain-containing protein [Subtercola frigoramans]MBM7471572.1 glycosyltransferase A (GT-A) superfamily protein (DUF2064 family) [Subtercola frigoramans]